MLGAETVSPSERRARVTEQDRGILSAPGVSVAAYLSEGQRGGTTVSGESETHSEDPRPNGLCPQGPGWLYRRR
jgi:hypothetical protein